MSYHYMALVPKSDFDRWKNGEILFDDNKFCSKEEATRSLTKINPIDFDPKSDSFWKNRFSSIEEYLRYYGYFTYEDFCGEYDLNEDDFHVSLDGSNVRIHYWIEDWDDEDWEDDDDSDQTKYL